jgi:hypothetical protein
VTAARVSSGGVWNTPNPRAGMTTPLFSVSVDTSGMVDLISLGDSRVVKEQVMSSRSDWE